MPQHEDAVLEDYLVLDGAEVPGEPRLLVSWTRHAVSAVTEHDLASGAERGALPLPGLGSAGRLLGRPEGGHEASVHLHRPQPGAARVPVRRHDRRGDAVRLAPGGSPSPT